MNHATGTPTNSASTASASGPGRRTDIALRVLQVILALFYVGASAVPKLIANSSAVESFDKIGAGMWLMYAIGILELAGGIALVVPWLSGLSALALIALMIGAFVTQMTVFDGENALTPLLFIVPLALIAWFRRGTVMRVPAHLRGLVHGQ